MTDSEARSMALAQKIAAAIGKADQPTRNARSILTDAAVWTEIATAIVEVVEGRDSIRIEESADIAEAEVEDTGELDEAIQEDVEEETDQEEEAEEEEDKPKRGRRKK